MSRQSIQSFKASNALCDVYVDTVNTKIKAHNALNAMFGDKVFVAFIQHCIQSD